MAGITIEGKKTTWISMELRKGENMSVIESNNYIVRMNTRIRNIPLIIVRDGDSEHIVGTDSHDQLDIDVRTGGIQYYNLQCGEGTEKVPTEPEELDPSAWGDDFFMTCPPEIRNTDDSIQETGMCFIGTEENEYEGPKIFLVPLDVYIYMFDHFSGNQKKGILVQELEKVLEQSENLGNEVKFETENHGTETSAESRLKYYEDLHASGRILELPCRMGEKVYKIFRGMTSTLYQIEHEGHIYTREVPDYYVSPCGFTVSMVDEWEKMVFPSKEAAEAAIEKLKK